MEMSISNTQYACLDDNCLKSLHGMQVCGGVDGGQGLFACNWQRRKVGGGWPCDFFSLQPTSIFASTVLNFKRSSSCLDQLLD